MFNQPQFLDSCNNLVQGDEMCHNMETSYMDFGYDAYIQSYLDTMNLPPVEMNITPTVEGDNIVVEPEDDDPDGGENVSYENSMQVAAHGLKDDEEVEAGYANNKYVKPEDPHPNELYRSLYSVSMMQTFLFSGHSELLQVLRVFY